MLYEEASRDIRGYGIKRHGGDGYGRIVFTNGCFDIFHIGHLNLLSFCSRLAGPRGAVVVGLNDDESVRRLKGPERPVFDLDSRAQVLIANRYVTHVVPFSEDSPLELIKDLRPDIVVKSSQYQAKDVVGYDICPVVLAPHLSGTSSTDIITRIMK